MPGPRFESRVLRTPVSNGGGQDHQKVFLGFSVPTFVCTFAPKCISLMYGVCTLLLLDVSAESSQTPLPERIFLGIIIFIYNRFGSKVFNRFIKAPFFFGRTRVGATGQTR